MIWCLHGAVGMEADWGPFGSAMERVGHEVRRVDLWRYLDEAPVSLKGFARSFCDDVVGEGAPGNVLVGYSMGGRLAMHALLEASRRESGLFGAAVIVSAHPGLQNDRERLERLARDAEWAGKALTGDWDCFLRAWAGQSVLGAPEGQEGLGDRRLLRPRRQAVVRSFMEWTLGQQSDLRERLGEIGCPILWVTGARDTKYSQLAATLVPELQAGRHVELGGAGHRVPWEAAPEFVREVREFLALGKGSA